MQSALHAVSASRIARKVPIFIMLGQFKIRDVYNIELHHNRSADFWPLLSMNEKLSFRWCVARYALDSYCYFAEVDSLERKFNFKSNFCC